MNSGNINLRILAEFEDMMLHDSGKADPMQILALGELIHHLRSENIWFGDGIFDAVPAMYNQLYTIHC